MDTKLIIRVESQGAKQATTDLAALEAQGARTERATDALAATTRKSKTDLEATAAATARAAQVDSDAAARIHDMVAASLARQAAQQKVISTDQAAAAAQAEIATATEALQARIEAMTRAAIAEREGIVATSTARRAAQVDVLGLGGALNALDGIMARTAKTAEDIAAQEAALDTLMAAGAISAEEQAAALAALTAQEEKLGLATATATVAMEAETEAAIGLKLASGGAVREYTALLDEILSGRTGRTPGTLAVLGTRLGLTQKLFSGTGLAALGAVAAVGAFVTVMVKAEEEDEQFNNAMERTGGYLGVTQGQFRAMASDIATGNITIGQAKKVLLEVANTGQFTGQQIEKIGQAALDMSKVTGMSVESAIKEFVKLGEDPVRESAKLNQQYHYLKASVFDQIDALERLGKTQQAGELAQEAAAKMAHQRNADMEQNLGAIQQGWQNVEKAASSAWNAIVDSMRAQTSEDELSILKKDLQELQHPSTVMRLLTSDSTRKESIAELQVQLAALQKVTDAKQADAAATAKIAQQNSDAIAATQKYGTSDTATQALMRKFAAEAKQMQNMKLPTLKAPNIQLEPLTDASASMTAEAFRKYSDSVTGRLESGGPQSFGEKEAAINAEYERERQAVLANVKLTEDQRTELELRLTKDRQQRLAALETQKDTMILSGSEKLFGGLAAIAKDFGGKQSSAYKDLFALSKGFAIAKAILDIRQAVADAFAQGATLSQKIAGIATATTVGASLLADIKSANYSGAYDAGGFIPGGSYGLVGEVGPELVAGPANVMGRADTAKLLGGNSTYAPSVHIDARGAGPDEVAKLAVIRNDLRKQLHADWLHFKKFGYFRAVA